MTAPALSRTGTPRPKRFTLPCTITVQNTWDALEAHVVLDDGVQPETGDRITVLGPRVTVPFGESITLRRDAEVRRASSLEKAWIKLLAYFEMTELYEVSFSPGLLKGR